MKRLNRRGFLKGAGVAVGAVAVQGAPAFLRYGRGEVPIKWGSIHPTTGPYATEAFDQKIGVEVAISDVNAKGGVMGRKVELYFRDDQFKWNQTTTHALDLLDNHKVDFLAGSMVSPEEVRLNEISRKRKIIYANYPQHILSTPKNAKKMSPWFFTANVTPYQTAAAVARYAAKNVAGKRWHFLGDDYIWPKIFIPAYDAIAKQEGAKFHKRRSVSWVPFPSSLDYAAAFPKILKAKPDVLFVTNFGKRQVAFVEQAIVAKLHEKIQIAFSITEITMPEAAGAGMYDGFFAGMSWHWTLKDRYPGAKDFYDKFVAKRKRPPSAYASSAYELTRLILDASAEIKSTDPNNLKAALEGRKFQYVKGPSRVRACDHVNIAEFFVLKGKAESAMEDKFDLLEIVDTVAGEGSALDCKTKGLV
ncbi:MAG: ABC transporter substrate-binding protein [Nitrospinota bacterium]|nr:ABC transporter substrate-binding protein [Nitrospinota bacterium]